MSHYYCGVGDKDVTAMGADIGLESIVMGGLAGAFIALGIIALLILGCRMDCWWIIGFGWTWSVRLVDFSFRFTYERIVNYHPNEWAVLFFGPF